VSEETKEDAAPLARALVPARFARVSLVIEVLLVLVPLLYILAGWRARG
jgi:hypothetical protein